MQPREPGKCRKRSHPGTRPRRPLPANPAQGRGRRRGRAVGDASRRELHQPGRSRQRHRHCGALQVGQRQLRPAPFRSLPGGRRRQRRPGQRRVHPHGEPHTSDLRDDDDEHRRHRHWPQHLHPPVECRRHLPRGDGHRGRHVVRLFAQRPADVLRSDPHRRDQVRRRPAALRWRRQRRVVVDASGFAAVARTAPPLTHPLDVVTDVPT